MDGPKECHTVNQKIKSEVNQKEKKKKIAFKHIHVESRKMVEMILFAKWK